MKNNSLLPMERFIQTLKIVHSEGVHLTYSWHRIYSQEINTEWVEQLNENPEQAETLEAFVSRFGRMQDTIADKLLPRWLIALAETPGSQIETLNRAERLGVIENVEQWLEARKLRNSLIHEYMENPQAFSEQLLLAKDYSQLLLNSYSKIRNYGIERMALNENELPEKLTDLSLR